MKIIKAPKNAIPLFEFILYINLFLHVDICKDQSSSPCVFIIYILIAITMQNNNSLASSTKMFMLIHHFIEIILNNLSNLWFPLKSLFCGQNIFHKTTIFDVR